MGMQYIEQQNLKSEGNPLVVCSLGDASITEGEVSEAFQMAALKQMPILYLVQDNGWDISANAEETRAQDARLLIENVVRLEPGVRSVNNTNRKLLNAYTGADGIKTGYTSAAGFNLVASAERGSERVIATVFGGKSSSARNAKVAELLDLGFRRAPSQAPVRKPGLPQYANTSGTAAKTIRLVGAVQKSLRPKLRPVSATAPQLAAVDTVAAAAQEDQAKIQAGVNAAVADAAVATVQSSMSRPVARPEASAVIQEPEQEIVTRLTGQGETHWGINVGRYGSRYQAEKVLLRTALAEMATLDGSQRKVVHSARGFDAHFIGMTQANADLACRRLMARNMTCATIGPGRS